MIDSHSQLSSAKKKINNEILWLKAKSREASIRLQEKRKRNKNKITNKEQKTGLHRNSFS